MLAAVPQPPTHMVMPGVQQALFTAFIFLPLGIAIVLAVRNIIRGEGPVLLLCLLGGAVAAVFEPIVDVLGLVFFPRQGSWVAFETMGRPVPLLIAFVYPWYVGGQGYLAYRLFKRGIDRQGVFRLWAIFFAVNIALETPGLIANVYTYYGRQPFDFWGFPLWWGFVNPVMPLIAGALILRVRPYLDSGWKLLGIIPLIPIADGLANGGVAWPMYATLNTDLPSVATYAAALVTLGLALYAVWIISLVVARPAEQEEQAVVSVRGVRAERPAAVLTNT
jgi:hypothetical protein